MNVSHNLVLLSFLYECNVMYVWPASGLELCELYLLTTYCVLILSFAVFWGSRAVWTAPSEIVLSSSLHQLIGV